MQWTAALLLLLGAASSSGTPTVVCEHSPPCTSRKLIIPEPPPAPKVPCVRFYLPNCGRYAATYAHEATYSQPLPQYGYEVTFNGVLPQYGHETTYHHLVPQYAQETTHSQPLLQYQHETTYNHLLPQYNDMPYGYVPVLPEMPLSYPQIEAGIKPTIEHIKEHSEGYLSEHLGGHVEYIEDNKKDCEATGQVTYSNMPELPPAPVIVPFEETHVESEGIIAVSKDDQYALLAKNPPPPPPTLPPVQDIEFSAMPPTPPVTIRPETTAEEVFTPPIAVPIPSGPSFSPPTEFIIEEQNLNGQYENEDYNKGSLLLENIPPAPVLPELDMSIPIPVPQISEKHTEVLRPIEYPTNKPMFNIVEEAPSFPSFEEGGEHMIIHGNIPPAPTLSPIEQPAKFEIQQHHIEGENQVYGADQYIFKQPMTVPCRLLKVSCVVEPIQPEVLTPALPTIIEIPMAHANIYQTGIVESEAKSEDSDCEPKTAVHLSPTFRNSITVNVPETPIDAKLKYIKLDMDSKLYDYPRPVRIVVKKRRAEHPGKVESTSAEETEK